MDELKIEKIKQLPLPILVKGKIEKLIKDKNLTPGSKLPTESELANMIGVSRATLREAFRLLQEEGVIISRHGVGTFVRSMDSLVRNPLEINYGVTQIIESMGLRAGSARIKAERTKADVSVSEKLRIDVGSSLMVIQRIRTGNGKPVVYTIDIMPEATLGRIDLPKKFKRSLYEFLEEKYDQKIDYGIARVIPTLAGAEVSKRLKIGARSVVLLIDQVDYNMENWPILYSQEYWRKDVFEFTIFRRRR